MRVGTGSVLFGAHCFVLHPWFVAVAWWRLYGFPWDAHRDGAPDTRTGDARQRATRSGQGVWR